MVGLLSRSCLPGAVLAGSMAAVLVVWPRERPPARLLLGLGWWLTVAVLAAGAVLARSLVVALAGTCLLIHLHSLGRSMPRAAHPARRHRHPPPTTFATPAWLGCMLSGYVGIAAQPRSVTSAIALPVCGLLLLILGWLVLHFSAEPDSGRQPGHRGRAHGALASLLLIVALSLGGAQLMTEPTMLLAENAQQLVRQWLAPPEDREQMSRRRARRETTAEPGNRRGAGSARPSGNRTEVRALVELVSPLPEADATTPLYLRERTVRLPVSADAGETRTTRTHLRDSSDGCLDGWVTTGAVSDAPVQHTVCLFGSATAYVCALPGLCSIETDSVIAEGDDSYVKPDIWGRNVTYRAKSRWVSFDELLEAERAATAGGTRDDLMLPAAVSDAAIQCEVPRTGDGPGALAATVRDLRNRFQEADQARAEGHGTDPILTAVKAALASKESSTLSGAAALFTFYLRAFNVPARMAVGYRGVCDRTGGEWVVFTGADRHAWTEVLFRDVGWVIVDVSPPPTLRPAAADLDLFGKAGLAELFSLAKREGQAGGDLDWSTELQLLRMREIQGSLFTLLSVFLVLIPVLILWQRWAWGPNRPAVLERPASPLRALTAIRGGPFELLCGRLARAGFPRRRAETGLEYLNRLKRQGVVGSELDELIQYDYGVRYSGHSVSRRRERVLRRHARAVCRRVRRQRNAEEGVSQS